MQFHNPVWHVARLRPLAGQIDRVGRELTEHGIDHFLPIEVRDIVHHRSRKLVEKRYPLLPGYVFVRDVTDFLQLSRLRTVAGIISGMDGRPLRIPAREVETLRDAEAEMLCQVECQRAKCRAKQDRLTQRRLSKHFPRGAVVAVNTGMLSGEEGHVVHVTGRQTVRLVLDRLKNLGTVELGVDELRLVEAA